MCLTLDEGVLKPSEEFKPETRNYRLPPMSTKFNFFSQTKENYKNKTKIKNK
jgi:hypothetical protein